MSPLLQPLGKRETPPDISRYGRRWKSPEHRSASCDPRKMTVAPSLRSPGRQTTAATDEPVPFRPSSEILAAQTASLRAYRQIHSRSCLRSSQVCASHEIAVRPNPCNFARAARMRSISGRRGGGLRRFSSIAPACTRSPFGKLINDGLQFVACRHGGRLSSMHRMITDGLGPP